MGAGSIAKVGQMTIGPQMKQPAALRWRTMRRPTVIPNEGSVARDHLAAERTLLAWIRTALGLIGLGVVLGKFVGSDNVSPELIGLGMIALGAVMLIYSLFRFERLNGLLEAGNFRPAFWGPVIIAVMSLFVTIGAVVIIAD